MLCQRVLLAREGQGVRARELVLDNSTTSVPDVGVVQAKGLAEAIFPPPSRAKFIHNTRAARKHDKLMLSAGKAAPSLSVTASGVLEAEQMNSKDVCLIHFKEGSLSAAKFGWFPFEFLVIVFLTYARKRKFTPFHS